MLIIRNPAHSRPLSNNVKRLMRESRASPQNPTVAKVGRVLGERDLAFCDLQGCIFMAAVDRGMDMSLFAPLFMNSQLSALIDFSFFHPGCEDVNYLNMSMLLKSPELIVDTLLWIEGIVAKKEADETARAALVKALTDGGETNGDLLAVDETASPTDIDDLVTRYEYAYLLGYIYRYETLIHEEASRMVYAVLEEPFLRETLEQMDIRDVNLSDCAGEICQRLDQLIVRNLAASSAATPPLATS